VILGAFACSRSVAVFVAGSPLFYVPMLLRVTPNLRDS
jgi:hypothetical protein